MTVKSLRPAMPDGVGGGGRVLASDNPGAGVVRVVGVADVDRDARGADGEDGLGVQHGGAAVAQLAQFAVGEAVDHRGVLDNPRVGGQQARNVGPVFVDRGVDGAGDHGAGDVGPAAAKGADVPVGVRPVETRDDCPLDTRERRGQRVVCGVGVQTARGVEVDHIGGVQAGAAQQRREHTAVESLAAAGGEVRAAAGAGCVGDASARVGQQGVDV